MSSSRVPFLYYSTSGQPRDEAFETWRALMAPMYDVQPIGGRDWQPGGSTILYQLGDILANRTLFSAQHIARDRRRIEATPDHFVFQVWRAGGYVGEIAEQAVTLSRGTVAMGDQRCSVDGVVGRADTLGLIVPRHVLAGLGVETHGLTLDPVRNRLLVARISALYRQLSGADPVEARATTQELTGFLRRLLDRSTAADVLEGAELDQGLLPLARRAVLANLRRPDLTPERLAAETGVSRATLYRIFGATGGVMAHVNEQRLLAIRDALADPLEGRSLGRLAEDHGISSLSQLSRTFRDRFGCSPRAWRSRHREERLPREPDPVAAFWSCFHGVGQGATVV